MSLAAIQNLLNEGPQLVISRKLAVSEGMPLAMVYAELECRYFEALKKGQIKEGDYLPCSVIDMYVNTTVKEFTQRKSFKRLKEMGLIDYKVMGLPARRCYKILEKVIEETFA